MRNCLLLIGVCYVASSFVVVLFVFVLFVFVLKACFFNWYNLFIISHYGGL